MAKYIVKANRTGSQGRITLPKLLLKEMEWKSVSHYVLEKVDTYTINVRKLHLKEEKGCQKK